MVKDERRAFMASPNASWNIYSAFQGLAPSQRISADNPAVAMQGIVIDYDSKSTFEEVSGHVNELPEAVRPQFLEQTLSGKWRTVHIFEEPTLIVSNAHAEMLMEAYVEKWKLATLLAGYDCNSVKPTQIWTNGGVWFPVNAKPVASELTRGIAIEACSQSRLFGSSAEISIEKLSEEVARRFPGRWQGEFRVDACGVRFWVDTADCPTGCQVKPDGMLCFTGKQAFVTWAEIFGPHWCGEQRALNLGRAADSIIFDGKSYWEPLNGQWRSMNRNDALLALKNRGLSDKIPKGKTLSDVECVLRHIQTANRIDGAGPLINYPPGLVDVNGRKILNTAHLNLPVYPENAVGDPDTEFPTIWGWLKGFFAPVPASDLPPLDVFLAWLQRFARAIRYHERSMGQAVMICGGVNTGKTLCAQHLVAPLVGGRWSNPTDYFYGLTTFSEDLFQSPLMLIDDEASGKNEAEKRTFAARIKSFVVNPYHTYHPKFLARTELFWIGRILSAMNDDPASTAGLPEVNEATRDKLMFFRALPRTTPWPANVEQAFRTEHPYFSYWLDKIYLPPKCVLTDDRMGVKSFFDPVILELSRQQLPSYDLLELIKHWIGISWVEESDKTAMNDWVGTPTELMSQLSIHDALNPLLREYTVAKMSKSLTTLARHPNTGVEFHGKGRREFRIIRSKVIGR